MKVRQGNRIINIIPLVAIYVITIAFFYSYLNAQQWMNEVKTDQIESFDSVCNKINNYYIGKEHKKGTGWKVFKRTENFWEPRLGKKGTMPDVNAIYNEWNDYKKNNKNYKNNSTLANHNWSLIGPTIKPKEAQFSTPMGMGRVNCIAFHPTNNNIFFIGASFGGIWKTTNGGVSWSTNPLTSFLSIGISDIAFCKSDPNIIYAATGDADAAGVFGQNFCYSIGVIKSTDGGNTWQKTPSYLSKDIELSTKTLISKIIVNPNNSNSVYIATNSGVYKSTDGGENWTLLKKGYFRDMDFKGSDTTVVFAAYYNSTNYEYSILKYSESKNTWTTSQSFGIVGRVALNVNPSNNNVIYAICSASDGSFNSFWKTSDGGDSWTDMANSSNTSNILGSSYSGQGDDGQGIYDLGIASNLTNPNEVYIAGINIWKSTNSGKNWSCISDWTGYQNDWVHADHHGLKFSNNNILYSVNDGGVNKSTNFGTDWSDISNGLSISQFYKISCAADNSNLIIAGSQDNGTSLKKDDTWYNVLAGDGMDCLIDHTNSQYIYGSLYYGSFYKSTDGGSSFSYLISQYVTNESGAWVAPFAMDYNDTKILYAGFENVWRSTNRGNNWTRISNLGTNTTLRSLAPAPSNSNYIYAGTYYNLYYTSDAGSTWKKLYSTSEAITSVTVHPTDPQKIWITVSGYSTGYKVLEYNGTKWTNISGTLPNVPVNCLIYQKDSPDRLYIGTDIGVFYRDNATNDWLVFGSGLPNVVICDLDIHYATDMLRAATYARGIWQTSINKCNITSPTITNQGAAEFCIGDTTRIVAPDGFATYTWSNSKTGKEIFVTESGNYYCTVTDANGCSAISNTINIYVDIPNELKIRTVGKYPPCKGDSARLSSSAGFSQFEWSNGETKSYIIVREPGDYYLTAYTSLGCKSTYGPFSVSFIDIPDKPVITQSNDTLISSKADSYQWQLDGVDIPEATNKTFKINASGKYTVVVSNSNGCSNVSDAIQKTSAVNDFNSSEFVININPNPSSDNITIKGFIPNALEYSIKIYNLAGKSMLEATYNTTSGEINKTLDLINYPNGAYIISIKSGNFEYNNRIIKK